MSKNIAVFGFLILLFACKGTVPKNDEEATAISAKKDLRMENPEPEKIQDSTLTAAIKKGKKIYSQNCVVCHQSSGGGVPSLNPPLKDTKYVPGDKKILISIILKGSSVGLEVNGRTYSNNMPGFSENLNNEEIANVLTYVRNSFGNKASAVSENEVKAERDKSQ